MVDLLYRLVAWLVGRLVSWSVGFWVGCWVTSLVGLLVCGLVVNLSTRQSVRSVYLPSVIFYDLTDSCIRSVSEKKFVKESLSRAC